MVRFLSVFWLAACAATVRTPTNSLQIESKDPGWVSVREPGWYSIALRGKVSEATVTYTHGDARIPMKVVSGSADDQTVLIQYLELSRAFRSRPFDVARDMCSAFPEYRVVEQTFDAVTPHTVCTVRLAIPPHTGDNKSAFELRGTVRVLATSHRVISLFVIQAANDNTNVAFESFRLEGLAAAAR
jgi:hypothetical protein